MATEQFRLSPAQLKRLRQCATYAGVDWKPLAARPSVVDTFCDDVERVAQEETHGPRPPRRRMGVRGDEDAD